ncbi:DExH-box splicing factor binding site-domain-containing protein [Apiospora kogelbergensis]|uniref:DExH-box splicing factor binding site-domain-containing protein n=1 Tax=Apiospora kogelbergensis TaxID=1337665 RepID=UPI003132794D
MSSSENHTQAPRIAIKFGAPSSSSSKPTSNRKAGQTSSALGKRPRPHALGGESESEDDAFSGKHEAVTSFGARGAQNDRQPRGTKSARTSSGPLEALPHEKEARFGGPTKDTEPADQDKGIKWGLTVTKKPVDVDTSPAEGEASEPVYKEVVSTTQTEDDPRKTEGRKIIIAGASNSTEDDALKRDFSTAAEVSTLEEYDQIPDGEFGLAMLRGMGFDGKNHGSRPKEVKRRPALLGLGAKEDEEIKKAELAQKRGHRERRPRLDEYRRDKEKEKERRHRDSSHSYKSERERDKRSHDDHRRRYDDRDRDSRRHRHGDSRH